MHTEFSGSHFKMLRYEMEMKGGGDAGSPPPRFPLRGEMTAEVAGAQGAQKTA